MNRKKLETTIETATFKFITMLKESASDSVMLWINRNRVDIDLALAQRILDQYKTALDTEAMSKMDLFMKDLDKELTKFSDSENPLPRTTEPASKPAPRKNGRKNA